MAQIHRGLKPGGVVGIVDHRAAPGAPEETGNTLHCIDPDVVIEQMQAAGFEPEGSAGLLANPEDDHIKTAFDPAIRGHTDRFVLRFRKPGG